MVLINSDGFWLAIDVLSNHQPHMEPGRCMHSAEHQFHWYFDYFFLCWGICTSKVQYELVTFLVEGDCQYIISQSIQFYPCKILLCLYSIRLDVQPKWPGTCWHKIQYHSSLLNTDKPEVHWIFFKLAEPSGSHPYSTHSCSQFQGV